MSSNAITWTIRSVNRTATALKVVDILYILNFPLFAFFAVVEYALWSTGSEHSVLADPQLDENTLSIVFVGVWLLRFFFRRRFTALDVFLAVFPTLFVGLLILGPSGSADANMTFSVLVLAILVLSLLCVVYLQRSGRVLTPKRSGYDVFSIISPLLNPYFFLGAPIYLLLLLISVAIVATSVSTGQYWLGFWLLLLVPFGVRFARKLTNPSARLLLKIDPRKAVLYLRTFQLDEEVVTGFRWSLIPRKGIEQVLTMITSSIGPFVAISNYNNKIQSIGAAKSSYEDDEWQDAVKSYLDQSELVIMLAGDSDAIDWELQTLVKHDRTRDALVLFGRPVIDKIEHMLDGKTLLTHRLKMDINRDFEGQEMIGVYLSGESELTCLVGQPNRSYAYVTCLLDFLKSRQS